MSTTVTYTGRPRSVTSRTCRSSARSTRSASSAVSTCYTSRVLCARDALSTGLGVLVGLLFFTQSGVDFASGAAVMFIVLVSLSTPMVLDMEWQYTFFRCQHLNMVGHMVHNALVWPLFWAGMVILSYSSHWALLMVIIYSVYYILVDSSLSGVVAAAMVYLSYWSADFAVNHVEPPIALWKPALVFIGAVLLFELVSTPSPNAQKASAGAAKVASSMLTAQRVAQLLLMSPLFVIVELSVALGLKQDFEQRIDSKIPQVLNDLSVLQQFRKTSM